jgi:Fe2+ or Zn2+ uptake regulation protein
MMDHAQRLRAADLRVTRPRIAVLQAVCANPHSDTEAIFEAVRATLPNICRQTVYDVLNALTDVGMLRRVQLPGSVARYECRVGDNHHHSVCRSCGAIADVDCVVGEAPCLNASHQNGFRLEEAEVIYWGLCPDCFTPAVRPVGTVAGNGGFVIRPGPR